MVHFAGAERWAVRVRPRQCIEQVRQEGRVWPE